MYVNQYQAAILQLLEDSPIVSPQVIDDVRVSVRSGEVELAFTTLCEWIYEDDLTITRAFYERLVAIAPDLNSEGLVGGLVSQVVD